MKGSRRATLAMVMLLAAGVMPAAAQLGALVSPGRLNKAHASLEGLTNCLSCHAAGQQVATAKCLSCHKPVAERIAQRKGVHRNVTTDCVACHVEHAGVSGELRPFDERRFDHRAETGFALDGLHAPVAATCTACHKTRSFLTAATSCASCHSDTHQGALGPNCGACHATTVRFADTKTRFDHTRTSFPLTGAHIKVTCDNCHGNKTYALPGNPTCATCHQDPHEKQFGASCGTCHTTATWSTRRVDHSRTSFPLKGSHAAVACAACHVKSVTTTPVRHETCAACHADPHRGTFTQDCASCHDETTFARGRFDHATTRFALTEGHAGLACAACHRTGASLAVVSAAARGGARPAAGGAATSRRETAPAARGTASTPRGAPTTARGAAGGARGVSGAGAPVAVTARPAAALDFRGLSLACASCHMDPHRNDLGSSCESCHSTKSFGLSTFHHARHRAFFEGGHGAVRCEQCHQSTTAYTSTATTCVSCHNDVHLGQVGTRCESCHAVDHPKFAVAGFSHATTTFPLSGGHAPLECAACHKRETAQFPAAHGTAVRLKGVGATCASCHSDPHNGQLGASCQQCHTADTFRVRGYLHRNARSLGWFFGGAHVLPCAECHTPSAGAGALAARTLAGLDYRVTTTCTNCHVDKHRGALGPRCESCHRLN